MNPLEQAHGLDVVNVPHTTKQSTDPIMRMTRSYNVTGIKATILNHIVCVKEI